MIWLVDASHACMQGCKNRAKTNKIATPLNDAGPSNQGLTCIARGEAMVCLFFYLVLFVFGLGGVF